MKKILFFSACLWALSSGLATANTVEPEVVLVRFSWTKRGNLLLAITRGEGKTEASEVPAGHTDQGFVAASEAEYKVLHQLYQNGYQLINSTHEYGGAIAWVFAKKH